MTLHDDPKAFDQVIRINNLAFRAIPEEQEVYNSFKTILKKLS